MLQVRDQGQPEALRDHGPYVVLEERLPVAGDSEGNLQFGLSPNGEEAHEGREKACSQTDDAFYALRFGLEETAPGQEVASVRHADDCVPEPPKGHLSRDCPGSKVRSPDQTSDRVVGVKSMEGVPALELIFGDPRVAFVLGEMTGERVMEAVALLPRIIGREERRVCEMPDNVIDPLVFGEGAVATVVADDEERESDHARHEIPDNTIKAKERTNQTRRPARPRSSKYPTLRKSTTRRRRSQKK